MFVRDCIVGAILALSVSTPLAAQGTDVEFFEAKIRPVLVQRCYCVPQLQDGGAEGRPDPRHQGGLAQGRRVRPAAGARQAGRQPADEGAELHRPARPDAADRQASRRGSRRLRAMDCQRRRRSSRDAPGARVRVAAVQGHVAGRRTQMVGVPAGRGACRRRSSRRRKAGPANKIDSFVLAKLAEKNLQALSAGRQAHAGHARLRRSARLQADVRRSAGVRERSRRRTPTRRSSIACMASPHYGERWGRHWMDVARYAEDNPTSEATNPPYPFAWRYRDWIIEAMNADMPYDRFVKLQLAADLMPDAKRDDMRALGYVGAAPIYHQDLRLSGDVIGGVPDRRLGRADRRGVARRARHLGRVRALPRSQVRSDHAEGLLRADGRLRVHGARRAADVRGRSEGRAAIHVAAAPAVRPGVFDQPARQ